MRYDDRSGQSLPADGPRSGVHAILKRFDRRVPAPYRLAYDHTAPTIPRLMARASANYDRAGSRVGLDRQFCWRWGTGRAC